MKKPGGALDTTAADPAAAKQPSTGHLDSGYSCFFTAHGSRNNMNSTKAASNTQGTARSVCVCVLSLEPNRSIRAVLSPVHRVVVQPLFGLQTQ